MILTVVILAAIGLILIFAGRFAILRANQNGSSRMKAGIILLPLFDFYFLIEGGRARNAALVSLLGSALTLPLLGQLSAEYLQPPEEQASGKPFSQELIALVTSKTETQETPEEALNREQYAAAKEKKVRTLVEYVARWYRDLQSRRDSLAQAGPQQIADFNYEASNYASLLKVTRTEAAELEALTGQRIVIPFEDQIVELR